MSGLRVWLHPSSRAENFSVSSFRFPNSKHETCCKLHATTLRRTATVVRNRRGIFNRANVNARSSEGADCRLAAGAGAAHADFNAAHAVVAGHAGGVRSGLLGGEWRTLTRSPEAERT